jgi:hypothetical protein
MTHSEKSLLISRSICGPHCDSRVLHAPGECEYCDGLPNLQYLRERVWRIAFTGRPQEGYAPCPAEAGRGMRSINSWGGNQAMPPPMTITAPIVEGSERLKGLWDKRFGGFGPRVDPPWYVRLWRRLLYGPCYDERIRALGFCDNCGGAWRARPRKRGDVPHQCKR